MTVGTREHYEMMADFETSARALSVRCGHLGKEDKEQWGRGHIYQDGETNGLFKLFCAGYSNARVKYING